MQFEDLETRVLMAGAATQLLLTVPPSQTAIGTPMFPAIQVTVADATGATVTTDTSTVVLSLVQNPLGGSLTAGGTPTLTTSVKAVNGVATFSNISFTAVGQYQIAVNDGSLLGVVSTTFSVSASPAKLAFSQQPTDVTAGTPFSPSIAIFVQDANGNLVSTDRSAITLSIFSGPSSGTLTGVTTINAVNGVATFNGISLSKPGDYKLQVRDGALTVAVSNLFTVSAGAPAKLVFGTSPVNTPVNITLAPVIVDVTDAAGNIVLSNNSAVTLVAPDGTGFSGTTTVNAVNGVATFTDLTFSVLGNYTLQATDGALTAAVSSSFAITGAPAKLSFQRTPSQTTVGKTVSPGVQVSVVDVNGNVVSTDASDVTINIGIGPSGGSISGVTTVTAVNGVATFNGLSFSAMGTYRLTAVDGALTGGLSNEFIINGTAAQLAFVHQPADTAAGTPLAPPVTVAVEDTLGNIVIDDSSIVTITKGSGPGNLSGVTQVAAVNGLATFASLTLSSAGTYTLAASETGLAGSVSSNFIILPAASQLIFLVQPSNFASGASMFPAVKVEVVDSLGHPATTNTSSITLTLLQHPRNGSISGTTTVAAVNGVATFSNLSSTVQGTYQFLAIDAGLGTAVSATFTCTAPAYQLQWAAQPVIVVTAGQTLNNLTIWVEDRNKHVVFSDHSTVTLATSSGPTGGSIIGTATATAVNGLVTFSGISFTKAGTYVLTVTDGSLKAAKSKKFDVVAAGTTSHLVATAPTSAIAGRNVGSLVVKIEDKFGNVIVRNSSSVTLTVDSGPGTLSGTRTVRASNGVAIFGNLTANTAGSYALTATDNALANKTTSFAMTVSQVSTIIAAPAHAASYAVGRAFTLRAHLSGLVGSPLAWTGIVRLVDASNNVLATNTVSAGGNVTFAVPGQTAGTYSLHVLYEGDTNHLGGASPPFSLVVGPGTTTRVTPSSKNITSGTTLTLSVRVAANNGAALLRTGTVQLVEAGVVINTLSLDGNSSGMFSLVPTVGSHAYTLKYLGDANYRASTTSPLQIKVV